MKLWLIKFAAVLGFVGLVLISIEAYAVRTEDSGFHQRALWFDDHAGEVRGLIFGPSLLVQSIDPDGIDIPTANLALSASAPDVDSKLLQKALEKADPTFILFDLTAGTLDRRKQTTYYSQRKLYYYFGVDYEGWRLKDAFFTDYPLYRYFYRIPSEQGFTNRGFPTIVPPEEDYFRILDYDKEKIANEKRLMGKMRKQGLYSDEDNALNRRDLQKVIELCRERGIKLIFLSPPKYELFNNNLKPLHRDRRQSFLDKVVDDETVFFWDYGRLGEEEPRNFRNINHMSSVGARVFTEALNERLNREFGD